MTFDAGNLLFFFGAGASAPFGIPTMKQFVVDFENYLRQNGLEDEKIVYNDIKEALQRRLNREVDLEEIFTVIDGVANYDSPEKLGMLSLYFTKEFKDKFPNVTDVTICKTLSQKFRSFVRDKCLIAPAFFERIPIVYRDFFNRLWEESTVRNSSNFLSSRGYKYCRNWVMFTTNYDTCLEHYWRQVARANLNTGFRVREETRTWVLDPSRFSIEGLKLLKLHGSISWLVEPDNTITEEQTVGGQQLVGRDFIGELMVYPIQQKELYLEPYVSMLKQLNFELKTKPIWIIVGYSFNDPVIQEIFVKNSDEGKKILLLHPQAQKVNEQRLRYIRADEIFLLNQKFGTGDFKRANYNIIKQFKTPNVGVDADV